MVYTFVIIMLLYIILELFLNITIYHLFYILDNVMWIRKSTTEADTKFAMLS